MPRKSQFFSFIFFTSLLTFGCAGSPHRATSALPDQTSKAKARDRVLLEQAKIARLIGIENKDDTMEISSPRSLDAEAEDEPSAPLVAPAPESVTTGASTACAIAASICESSRTICEISLEYPSDEQIASTCDWAKDECVVAASRCDSVNF